MNLTVKSGQSLWSIAQDALPKTATNAQIQAAVVQLAQANHLAPDARLKVGQSLVVPDRFGGAVTSDATVAGSLGRLSNPSRTNPTTMRAAGTAKPLVDVRAVFSSTTLKPAGEVALPNVAGVKLEGQLLNMESVRSSLGASATQSVEGKLGKLTQAQFDDVKKELGGRSNVAFDPNRSYTLADFLPPTLQALLHQDLEISAPVTLKGTKNIGEDMGATTDKSIGLTMNCHATAWEAVRAYQGQQKEVAIFYGEMITMDGYTADAAQFKPLKELTAAQLGELKDVPLQPGDVVQFHEVSEWARMTMLLHSAVYVGGGLFFEKPNTEGAEKDDPANYVRQDETPFRLATPEMMAAPISAAVEGKYRMVVLRAQQPLEEPAKAFASSLKEPLEAWATKKGRTLGVELVMELEQGMGGGVRAEHAAALVRVPLHTTAEGLGQLKT